MRVRVSFIGESLVLASVHAAPSLLERLWSRDLEAMAVAVPEPGGGRLWLWDDSGRRITSRRIVAALEQERGRVERGESTASGSIEAS